MSQTKVLAANLGSAIRQHRSSGAKAGAGGSTILWVGRDGSYDYDSFLRFALDWTDVGQIVSAILTLRTSDPFLDIDTEHPTITFARLTGAFSEHSNNSSFTAGDYTNPKKTGSGQFSKEVSHADDITTDIDVTAFVEAWAPANVKKRNGQPGSKATNYGIGLYGSTSATKNWYGFSEDYSDGSKRPYITLTYEYGPTIPATPTNLSPSGTVASIGSFQADFDDARPTDTLAKSRVQVFGPVKSGTAGTNDIVTITAHGFVAGQAVAVLGLTGGAGLSAGPTNYFVRDVTANTFKLATVLNGTAVNITVAYSAIDVGVNAYDVTQAESVVAIGNGRADHVPANFHPLVNREYRWRIALTDQESQVSPFSTPLTSVTVTNNDPDAPTLTPDASTYATLDGVQFESGAFSDPDAADDFMLAYQVQLSALAEGSALWDDNEFLKWDTGKRYRSAGSTTFRTPYGGAALTAGGYTWRARVWDQHDGVSDWEYATLTLTEDFNPDTVTSIQMRPKAPWRIVIKGMGALRGPGTTVAILTDAMGVGASAVWNSPGELHFTLPIFHPQIDVIEPKQTHYSVQFHQGGGWRERYAGLMWDYDATDTDIVFYGIDYLALYDYVADERYDPARPNLPSEKGGSFYLTTGKNSIKYIVTDQLSKARLLPNSPVGFITVGAIGTMNETVAIYSTYAKTLNFVTALLESHRAGTGKRTRLMVRQKTGGGYEVVVLEDPGTVRDNLRLRYGELVMGYRVIPFGQNWGTRVNGVGRAKDGVAVLRSTQTAPGIDEAVWGRFASGTFIDGVTDINDLKRRIKQLALHQGKLGNSVALGIRSGVLRPFDGFDIADNFPVSIEHGHVSTAAFGSGYWTCVGITWEVGKGGKETVTLSLQPREDTTAPDADLLTLSPISPQREWRLMDGPPSNGLGFLNALTDYGAVAAWNPTSLAGVTDTINGMNLTPNVVGSLDVVAGLGSIAGDAGVHGVAVSDPSDTAFNGIDTTNSIFPMGNSDRSCVSIIKFNTTFLGETRVFRIAETNGYGFVVSPDGPTWSMTAGAGSVGGSAPAGLIDGSYHMCVWTYNGTTHDVKFYMDGTLRDTDNFGGAIASSGGLGGTHFEFMSLAAYQATQGYTAILPSCLSAQAVADLALGDEAGGL